ncbi:MAG: Uma2 family endonuclease [Desulfobacterales bacterium]
MLPQESYISPEEYLEMERASESKSQYIDGEIFAMAGASRNHNRISSNLVRAIGNQLVNTSCNVYSSDMKVKIDRTKYTYPDIVITCEKEDFEDESEDVLLNPLIIIEILSDSTEAYDRGKKFAFYQRIPSVKEYFLVSQHWCCVERYVRQDSRIWRYSAFQEADSLVVFSSVNCELPIAEIYRNIVFRKKG